MTSDHLTTKSSINGLKREVDSIDLTEYVKKSDYDTNSKVGELENKIKTAELKPDISGLGNKTELKYVENEIRSTDLFVKKN